MCVSYQFDSCVECSQDTSCPSAISLHPWHSSLGGEENTVSGYVSLASCVTVTSKGQSTLVLRESPPVS